MTELPFARIVVLAVVLAGGGDGGLHDDGYSGTSGGGGYSGKGSRGGGWENFRAEAPVTGTGVDDVRSRSRHPDSALAIVGCSDMPKDGRYQTGGGGWDNFRAEAAEAPMVRST